LIFFIKNCCLLIPRPPKRTPKLQEKPSALKKEYPALQNMKILYFFYFCGSFLPSWIRIHILNLNADPDPATQINADPDPDPKPCPELPGLRLKTSFGINEDLPVLKALISQSVFMKYANRNMVVLLTFTGNKYLSLSLILAT
jgi:hypothetical protein